MASTKSGSTKVTNSTTSQNSNSKTVNKNVNTLSSKKVTNSTSNTTSGSDTVSDSTSYSSSNTHGVTRASGQVDELTQQKRAQAMQDYQQSDSVQAAYQQLQDKLNNEPGPFSSEYKNTLDNLYTQMEKRGKFTYDVNGDPLYEMYKGIYEEQGKKAMSNTMAQAAALTGGYGSSYSQTAGQQAYQNYLEQLQDRVPELRNQAYQEYQNEGNELLNRFNMANTLYGNEFQEHRADVSDYQADRSFLQGQYQDERNFDYNQYAQNRDFWNNEYWNEKNAEHTTDSSTSGTETTHGASSTKGYSNTTSKTTEKTKSKEVSKGTSQTSSQTNSSTNETSNESSWATSSGSGRSGGSGGSNGGNDIKNSTKRTEASTKKANRQAIDDAIRYLKTNDARKEYLAQLYDDGRLSEGDLNYFLELYFVQKKPQ